MEEQAVRQGGESVVPERLTQQDIAARIGGSREMVSRILTDLTRGGYIALEDKRMVIRKKIPRSW